MIWSGFFKFLGIIFVLFIIVLVLLLSEVCFGDVCFCIFLVLICEIELIFFCLVFKLFGRIGKGDDVFLRGFIIFFR